ncbi:pimeloyl-ACP methyl ester carboxylesterase [Thermocatellispora tengchongensis]|uniref:Pimeloyl-ACP methyl ester carboxylesterase n=1 Tax=Thermocatellispora tengchongensis TaxID=1073253 RepID=A0A840P3Q7_9ACTN|nr:alpha/beta fold hydrolase [Thermocatellispora tengchongensis]MBB5133619.1 pimeloyl-ACP methyl ester carboxylesterase [Thermocatellispora tengchongensis]
MAADFLLVHGAWHGSAHWAKVSAELAALGHRPLALDLPGHGLSARFPTSYFAPGQEGFAAEPSPVKDVTLDVAAGAVVAALRALRSRPSPGPVALVAHSIGGAVATRAAELAPDLVDHIVYVAAFVPTRARAAAAYLALPENGTALGSGLYLGDPAVTGAVRINPRSCDPAYLAELRAAYFTGAAEEVFLACAAALTPDQPLGFLTGEPGATAARWGAIPRTYVRCALDRALPPALQDVMIRDADALAPATPFRTLTLDTGHAPFATMPAELARALSDAVPE